MSTRQNIQTLIDKKGRRLQKLKEQEAISGLSTDPSTLIQIEDLERELKELRAQLARTPDSSEPVESEVSPSSPTQPAAGPVYHINTGGGAVVTGQVDTGGGDFVGRDQQRISGLSAADVARLFEAVYQQIEAHPDLTGEDKADLTAEVKEVETEVVKPEPAINESFLSRRLRHIKRMAPDILDVIAATLTSPTAGFGQIARKVAEKMKGEGV